MSDNRKKRKYRRLPGKQKAVEHTVNTTTSCQGLYFYSNEYVGEVEKNGELSVKYRISGENNVCLNNHTIFGQFVFPTDAYLEMLVVACKAYLDIDAMVFNNIVIVNPLTGNATSTSNVTIVFQKEGAGFRFVVRSDEKTESGKNREKIHIRGTFRPIKKRENNIAKYSSVLPIKDARQFSVDKYYSNDSTIVLGEFYNSLKNLTFGETQAVAKIELDPDNKGNRFLLHPAVVSAALANAMSYGPHRLNDVYNVGNDVFLPYKIDGLFVFGPITGKSFISLAEVRNINENWVELYLEIVDEDNNVLLSIETIRLQRVKPDRYQTVKEKQITGKNLPVATPSGIINKNSHCAGDIAVIGMSCRFPMSKNIEEFWDILKDGRDCITKIPEDRWQEFDHWYNPDPDNQHTSYSKWGGFIDDVDKFDPLFFNISPSEAELMDPQQRIFLEEAWRTLENAGYSSNTLNAKNCGVFVGCTTGDYDRILALGGEDTNGQSFMGTSSAILAARISYILNLKGPSLSVDTACSSSLTAIHLACMSIRNGESDMAIAGGVSIFSTPLAHILTSRVRMQSMDGRCFTFDQSANGTVFSEGCGIVMLKSLAQAEQDGDNIIGVIKGSGVNQDGKTNGITAPSAKSQESLLRSIYKKYSIDPDDITYVEAHGTATPLGDPIEFQALTNTFRYTASKKQYCAMGSVKSNIGHGSYAAGVAGLIKTLLCLKHNKYVPTVHFREANNIIDFEQSPFFVSKNYEHWPEPEHGKRMAAVSSFGFSGANAHMVLEEYKDNSEPDVISQNMGPVIVPLSAKNRERLVDVAVNLANYLRVCLSGEIADIPPLFGIAYTLQTGRDAMDERVVFVVHSVLDLLHKLDEYTEKNENINECYQSNVKRNKTTSYFGDGTLTKEMLASWMQAGMTEKYLDLWVNGMPVDWNILYGDKRPRKVALPSCPFARERYWVTPSVVGKNRPQSGEGDSAAVIHPLVQVNKSDLFSQTYCSVFDGSEYFFTRNTASRLSTMGDLVFLEMARVAIMAAVGDAYEYITVDLDNTRWLAGVVVGEEPVRLHIDLHEAEFDSDNHLKSVNYTIYSVQDETSDRIIHVQGTGSLKPGVTPQNINITALLENTGGPTFDSAQCDELYALLNLDCVPSELGIRKLFPGDGQAIVQHYLPDDLSADNSEYVLHPALMTLVCKTAAAIVKGISNVAENESKKSGEEKKYHDDDLFLMAGSHSISVEKIEIITPPRGAMYTWIRYARGGSSCGSTFKMDISLCDEQGHVCVKITGYEIGIYLSDSDNNDCSGERSLLPITGADNRRLDTVENIWTRPDTNPVKYGGAYLMVCGCERMGELLAEYLIRSGAKRLVVVIRSTSIDSFRHKLKMTEESNVDIQYISIDSLQSPVVEEALAGMKNLTDEINGIFYTGTTSEHLLTANAETGSEAVSAVTVFDKIYTNFDGGSEYPDFVCNVLSDEIMVRRQFTGRDRRDIYRVAQITSLDEFQNKRITCGKSVVIDWGAEDTDEENKIANENNKRLCSEFDFLEKVFTQVFIQGEKYSLTIVDQGQSSYKLRFLDELQANDDLQLKDKETTYNDMQGGSNGSGTQELETSVGNDLKEIIHAQLKINRELLDADTNFSEFGFDSILLTEFSHRLSKHFGTEISPAVLFGNYTLEKLTTHLLSENNEEIIQHYTNSHNTRPHNNVSLPKRTPAIVKLAGKQKWLTENNKSPVSHPEVVGEHSADIVHSDRVAVIGMSGKLPMADDLDVFWDNLKSGKDCISGMPFDRSGLKEEPVTAPQHEMYMTQGGFIDGIAEFDPEFFGISDREAELMDPNQRLIMTCVYHAIEDAGYSPKSLSGKNVAVFIGTANSGYDRLVEKSGSEIEAYTATGTQPSVGPNRISYYLDLRGPSEPIETACASSLVAIRRGIAALNDGCEMAIVGGVNTLLTSTGHIAYDKAGMLSADGRCKTFSTNANGFVRSEGIGILILKKLENAEKEGDHIYGLICGSAENHGGRAHSLTTPNPIAQTELLEKAYKEANIDPRTVTCLEAHGTGTRLGDSIEIDALKTAFKSLHTWSKYNAASGEESSDEKTCLSVNGYCGLGSVKTNIGHTELASGVVGVIKVLLQLKHKMLVKNLNTNPLNPYLQLEGSPFFVIQNTQEWQILSDDSGNPIPRRAGVSSFGMGGVNAHVILEEYINRQEKVSNTGSARLVVFSASNKKQLETVARQMLDYVLENEELSLARFAYTLQVGRDQLDTRLAMIVSDREMLITGIKHFLDMDNITHSSVPLSYSGEGKGVSPDHQSIRELIHNNNLEEIGQCWVHGGKVPWELLYKGRTVKRLSLPTYPFDNRIFWISGPGSSFRESVETPDIRNVRARERELLNINGVSKSPLFESWFIQG